MFLTCHGTNMEYLLSFLYSHKAHPVKWRGVWELKLLPEVVWKKPLGAGITINDCPQCWAVAQVWAGCGFTLGSSPGGMGGCSAVPGDARASPLLLLLWRVARAGSCHHLVPKRATAGWACCRQSCGRSCQGELGSQPACPETGPALNQNDLRAADLWIEILPIDFS